MPSSVAAGANGSGTGSIGPWVALITARSSSDSSIASGSLWSTASATAASVSVPFSISRSMRILNSRSVGSWRTDCGAGQLGEHVERALQPRASSPGSVAIVNQRLKSWSRR